MPSKPKSKKATKAKRTILNKEKPSAAQAMYPHLPSELVAMAGAMAKGKRK